MSDRKKEVTFDSVFMIKLAGELVQILGDEYMQTHYPTLIEYIQTGIAFGMNFVTESFQPE